MRDSICWRGARWLLALAGAGALAGLAAAPATGALEDDARAAIQQARKPLVFKAPGPSIDAARLRGRRVLIVSVDQRVPALAATAKAIQEAGRVAGLRVSVFDAKADPARMTQGVRQASQQSNAMILLGIPIALV
jgi:hypothetical protein